MRAWLTPRKTIDTSGPAITRLIEDQLLQARTLKDSLESRASVVIASSGTLVTLLLALVTLVGRPAKNYLPLASRFLIVLAIAGFLAAAAFAILVVRPREYAVVDENSLRDLANSDAYSAPAAEGEPRIALALIGLIEKTRHGNMRKAHFLMISVIAEMIAVVVLGLAIGVTLAAS
jgi:hypothetical protein